MRIAEVSAFSQYSVGKIMKDIKNYLCQTENVCKIFYARGDINKDPNIIKVGSDYKIKLNALNARLFDNDGFCMFSNTKKLVKHLEEFNPDIVHIHCLHGYYTNSKILFKYFKEYKNIKVVWTMHDTWAFTGHCCYFGQSKCEKWINGCHSCPSLKDYPKAIIDKSKRNYLKKKELFTSLPKEQLLIVSPSLWLKELLSKSYLSKYDTKVIHNGVNTDIFNTSHSEINNPITTNKKVILGVNSVWDSRKGLNCFKELSSIVDDNWQVIVIGKIDCDVSLPENVIHIERTNDQNELKYYYQNASVLLNSTLDDNYPTVNLEAQLCGCKVVSFNTGGCKETDLGNLYLIDSHDPRDVYELIKKVDLEKVNNILVEQAKDSRMSKEYFELFKEMVDGSSN